MGKLTYCALLLLIAGAHCAQVDDDDSFPDYWQSEYDNLYDYDFLKDETKKLETFLKSNEDIPVNDNEVDKKVQEEIERFREENENGNAAKEVFDDYQFEDNREKSQEERDKDENDNDKLEELETLLKSAEVDVKETQKEESGESNIAEDNDSVEDNFSKQKDANADYALLWGDKETTPLLPVPIVEDDKAIFNETLELLSEVANEDNAFDDTISDTTLLAEESGTKKLEEIMEETKKILEESENEFDDVVTSERSDESEEVSEKNDKNTPQEVGSEEDTVDEVQEELDEDLQKLFETLNKLSEDEPEKAKEDEDVNPSNVFDYEEKNDKSHKEELTSSDKEDQNQDYELIDDSNLSEIFSETSKAIDESLDDNRDELEEDRIDAIHAESKLDDVTKSVNENQQSDKETTTMTPIMYGNDALVDDVHRADSSEVEEFDILEKIVNDEGKTTTNVAETGTPATHTVVVLLKKVEDLTSAEQEDLMAQFSLVNSENLDVHSDNFLRNVAPIHIALNVDEPTVVTSPNYPNAYPRGNIVDWIFEGEGTGIELNITNFAVNGAVGDYMLVKPGGIDETGHTGLVFSYQLTSERRYRFTDVDRMFVRFEATPRMAMSLTGFRLSVKMISPAPEEPEEIPEPEPVLTPPAETLTVHLGGVTLESFQDMKETFRELVADMATQYIRDNNIDPGMNYTIEITQLTSTALCNVNWPNFTNCAQVTFGVPLSYEEVEDMEYRLKQSDLEAMWMKYITRDPFALRLRRMGITEFAMPDDSSVMMVWLVIAAGVLISMAMLAFALWRFSCFEDYTRMPAYSDTDSLQNEKRGLDLYPTPHQILPPLYAENDYKWADDTTRVDMGGFANKSYARDDLYDFDSEEEAVPNRDRFTSDV